MYLKGKNYYKALEAFLSGGRVIDAYIVRVPAAAEKGRNQLT
jgi:hypothetical protein